MSLAALSTSFRPRAASGLPPRSVTAQQGQAAQHECRTPACNVRSMGSWTACAYPTKSRRPSQLREAADCSGVPGEMPRSTPDMILDMLTHSMCSCCSCCSLCPASQYRLYVRSQEGHTVPIRWTELGPASKRDNVHLQIGLKQQNEGIVAQLLIEISDPNHAR